MPVDHPNFLILDGISGVPLGREIAATLLGAGYTTHLFDCLSARQRPLYGARAAWAKALDRKNNTDSFQCLPRLDPNLLEPLIRESKPSHILIVGFIYKFFDPRHLRELAEKYKARLLLYDTDSCNLYDRRREFIFFVENELPIYDRIFSFSKVTTRFFRETRCLNAVHLPFGAHPLPVSPKMKTCDALFVGTCDLRRILLLEAIREHVTVRGNRWRRNAPLISKELNQRIVDQPLWGNDLHASLGGAKIVLNITRTDFFGAETGVNLRIFEALSAGCFLLTDHCEEIAELFEIGREIDTFRSSSELVDKVKYYLSHDAERERIARHAFERFSERHTWRARLASAFIPNLP